MIAGHMSPYTEAVLQLVVSGPSGEETVDAVIDTGFSESLTLPPAVTRGLGLTSRGSTGVTLADGQRVTLNHSRASILWHGRPRDVTVLEATGDALVGMELLYGNRVILDVVGGGHVTIEPLP